MDDEMGQSSPILRYFNYEHLLPKLQTVSEPFHSLAWRIEQTIPSGPEKSVALRKLLESKDAAVRAASDHHTSLKGHTHG